MKKVVLLLLLFAGFIACKNEDIEFADYKYTTAYFPYQYPVRTLVLGNYEYDNTNDNNHRFLVSLDLGGVYSNDKDRVFDIAVDESLCDGATFASTGEAIRVMPKSYYTLSSNKLTILKGAFYGSVEVQLTDAFFNDPLAIKLGYVVPVRAVASTDVDSILVGTTAMPNADPRVAGDWDVTPKNFTMFAVKFINPYHGKYLHRGASIVKDASNAVLEKTAYRTTYITNNEIWSLVTTGKKQVSIIGNLHSSIITGSLNMLLDFSDDGTCTVTQGAGSLYTISGTGKFSENADEWGNKKRDAIHLNYQVVSGSNTYSATDTLVIRDRAITLETYTPNVL
jgi:hypothetical protein